MSLEVNLQNLITAIGTEMKDIRASVNSPTAKAADVATALNTTATTIVGAINELLASVNGLASTDGLAEGTTNLYFTDARADARVQAAINDSGVAATDLWSAVKIGQEITGAINGVLDGAPAALDTLNELAAAINDNGNYAAGITAALALKADKTEVKTVTELGATVDTHDYVADWNAAIA